MPIARKTRGLIAPPPLYPRFWACEPISGAAAAVCGPCPAASRVLCSSGFSRAVYAAHLSEAVLPHFETSGGFETSSGI